jgi:hypothetical protein
MPKSLLAFVIGIFIGAPLYASALSVYTVPQGGTGAGTFSSSKLLYGAGTGPLQSVATTTASCSGNASCSPFTIIGSSPVTISASGGGGSDAFTHPSYGGSATTSLLTFSGGLLSTASSTFTSSLHLSALLNGMVTVYNGLVGSAATTTFSNGAGISVSYSGGVETITNTGVTSNAGDWAGTWQTFSPSHFQVAGNYLASYDAFTHPSAGVSATTSAMIFTNASSTFTGNLNISGNSTTTNATSTNFFAATASSTNLFAITGRLSNLRIDAVGTGLILNTSGSNVSTYAGSNPCTNQVALSLNASGVITCTSVTNAMLSNSSTSFTSSDSSLTVPASIALGASGSFVLNLAHSNTFTAGQMITASSTIGGGTQADGLSVAGGATTTGFLTVQGTGTTTVAGGINVNTSAGCLAQNSTCLDDLYTGISGLPRGAKIASGNTYNMGTGTTTLYTVPAGRVAILYPGGSAFVTGATRTFQLALSSGSFKPVISGILSLTAGVSTYPTGQFVLMTAGESLVASSSLSGTSLLSTILELPSTFPIVTASSSAASANTLTTVYTAPAGKSAWIYSGPFDGSVLAYSVNSFGQSQWCSNMTGGTASTGWYIVPSGGGAPIQIAGTTTNTANLAVALRISKNTLNTGDSLAFISTAVGVFCSSSVIETTN